jgi:hypothetical protein
VEINTSIAWLALRASKLTRFVDSTPQVVSLHCNLDDNTRHLIPRVMNNERLAMIESTKAAEILTVAAAAAATAAASSILQVVSLHCNLGDNTRHLINRERLTTIKPATAASDVWCHCSCLRCCHCCCCCNAQVVSLHCNLDDNTRHLMNKERLAMMKPNAVLVNAARGPCIDEAALVKHMQENPDFKAGEGSANKVALQIVYSFATVCTSCNVLICQFVNLLHAVLVNAARGPCIDEAALVKHMQETPNFRAGADPLLKAIAYQNYLLQCCNDEISCVDV